MGCTIGVQFQAGAKMVLFLFAAASRPALGPIQPPAQWVAGAITPGIKRPVHEADHSPPSSAEVKNAWGYTSTPQYVFTAWCLIKKRIRFSGVALLTKHRDNFTFSFFPLYLSIV
jgi:hypothetical protein